MPQPSLDLDERKRRKALVEQCLKDGFSPIGILAGRGSALEEAGRRDGRISGFFSRWSRDEEAAKIRGVSNHIPDWSLFERETPPPATPQPIVRPRVRVKQISLPEQAYAPKRIVAIGDLHVQPGMDNDRLAWIARYIGNEADDIDYVLQIGDWCSWDSCSGHDPNDTIKGRYKPTFRQDFEAFEDSLAAFHRELPVDQTPSHHITFGNHEERVERFENLNPELEGDIYLRLEQEFARYRWKTYQYGEFAHIEGVSFTHVPKNLMGRPYGGKASERTIANDAACSIVYGHTHRRNEITVPKIGIANAKFTILNLGSAMPNGYVASYAKLATAGWSYGIYDLQVMGGQILSSRFVSMLDLERRFA